ncbi:hypothetical protein FZI85_27580 [Mycobacterium sp. CBMA293]|uniref:Uncharacterized protein n=1 Tax=Mycolicibacterium sp. CBMA 213 TaxID=1968788 RepID=A0A1S6GKR5_9MYCO|nr:MULTISPECIES: hypothetical protein [unclassified Mycolicibacterium]AQS22454.1 hypothetical protein pCBMA213_2_00090 [Mycolicibacterium sp. CBMA 213]MUL48357.1 hypothetical protein [Mycolicibacterium sp. CBMA 360]MUL62369.1 hypothetical protein [Mycolicibacterium sp. CBMA 335]MUM04506.1 hypothetical protein [Mycolicibacterium sp. CBMA 213]MUM14769.1 hypothetical protein [Mycolicibacterium sp. CBMA 293]
MAVYSAHQHAIVTRPHHRNTRALTGLFTIQQVGQACGLPGPVIMQLVPRTWTAAGWMYTASQLRDAAVIAANMRRPQGPHITHEDLGDLITCDGCGVIAPFRADKRADWLHWLEPASNVADHQDGTDFCPECATTCPQCAGAPTDELCDTCICFGRIPKTSPAQPLSITHQRRSNLS